MIASQNLAITVASVKNLILRLAIRLDANSSTTFCLLILNCFEVNHPFAKRVFSKLVSHLSATMVSTHCLSLMLMVIMASPYSMIK